MFPYFAFRFETKSSAIVLSNSLAFITLGNCKEIPLRFWPKYFQIKQKRNKKYLQTNQKLHAGLSGF